MSGPFIFSVGSGNGVGFVGGGGGGGGRWSTGGVVLFMPFVVFVGGEDAVGSSFVAVQGSKFIHRGRHSL